MAMKKVTRLAALALLSLSITGAYLDVAQYVFGWPDHQPPIWAALGALVILGLMAWGAWDDIDPLCRDDVYHYDKSEGA